MNEMAKRKKESTPGENLARQIIDQYQPKSVEDMLAALKDIFGPMFEAMLQGEMNDRLGYESNNENNQNAVERFLYGSFGTISNKSAPVSSAS